MLRTYAELREICPDGKGLFFFKGCKESKFKSETSFKMYTKDEIKEKDKKPIKAIIIFS